MQEQPHGYNKYTSVMVIDQDGGLGTFTSSSWGGHYAISELVPAYRMQKERALPVCELRTRDRNDDFGNIDPMFKIVGWQPKSAFEAILGPSEPLALEGPESGWPEQIDDADAAEQREKELAEYGELSH
jgi:hypothetical protein